MAGAVDSTDSKTTIIDLNDDCLISVCLHLDQFDLYALRDAHSRFTHATEHAYKENEIGKSWEFDYEKWLENKRAVELVKILEYFGHCMTRARIDISFTKFVRDECVSQSFLSDRLKNVRKLRLEYVWIGVVDFLSTLEHVDELEVKHFGWMPYPAQWPKLNKLTMRMGTFFQPIDTNAITIAAEFIRKHKHIQKLEIDLFGSGEDEEAIIEMIATNMCDLTELNASWMSDKKMEMIFTFEKLQKLELTVLDSIGPLKQLKNLKYLSVTEHFDIEHLYEIVEAVPSLTHLKVAYEVGWLDSAALETLIAKRQLSPYCEDELLRIENRYFDEDDMSDNLKWNEKYVSCIYRYTDAPEVEVINIGIGGITPEEFLRQFAAHNVN